MTTNEIDAVAQRAALVARSFAKSTPRERATALVAVAEALDAAAAALIAIAMRETGLAEARLTGEVRRTTSQLRLFAEVIVDGSYLDARIDASDPDYVIGPRPDVRRVLGPVGPVLNFAASNFPFAFSVAGGDTAAALAAGCPVVVKAHPGHPELSRATAVEVEAALAGAGMPDGVFQMIEGQENGTAMLRHPAIRAASFTGSGRVGRMLADVAAARPTPIPFYGELGSVNPVYVTAGALAADPDLLSGYAASVAGSAGQLCTKPGLLFVPERADLSGVMPAAAEAQEHRLLGPSIGRSYEKRKRDVVGTAGVSVLAEGCARRDSNGQFWVTPTIVEVSLTDLEAAAETLTEEAFGPMSIVVRYRDFGELPAIQAKLFPGNLATTIHSTPDEADAVRPLVTALAETSGRVLFGGWPTGVSVTSAMQHGGPYPATTTDATSVGTAAITRFLRGVAYQDAPQALLPEPLQDANPWGVPQRRSKPGLSARWGSLQARY